MNIKDFGEFIEEVNPEDLKRGDKLLLEGKETGSRWLEVVAVVDGEMIITEDMIATINGNKDNVVKKKTFKELKRDYKIYRLKDVK